MSADLHDPGGKVRLGLLPGVQGHANFSPCGRFRYNLLRYKGDAFSQHPYALWIGMNPSTAEAYVDDPTVRWEQAYTFDRLGLQGYAKVNIMDRRETYPKALLPLLGSERSSAGNIQRIVQAALLAERVIAVWGALPIKLRPHAEVVENYLTEAGVELWCVGINQDKSPKHPLYTKRNVDLRLYNSAD